MALVIPGLGVHTAAAPSIQTITVTSTTRTQPLPPRTEWRFEVSFASTYTVKLTAGNAEHFGTELAPGVTYNFTGCKGAIFSWQGCTLELAGVAEAEYLGEDTTYAVEWLNVHGALNEIRDTTEAPRIILVGPDNAGKSSLARSLVAWAVRTGKEPVIVNLDPREGVLAPPGSLSAAAIRDTLDIELGYGVAPITGPTSLPVKSPVVHSWPLAGAADNTAAFKELTTRMALHVSGRTESDPNVKRSGIIVDTPGFFNDPKSFYDILHHVISEFSITHIFVLESERLNSDLQRKYSTSIPVIKLRKPAGAVERDKSFMKQLRARQMRSYFFGSSRLTLNPHSHSIPFSDLHIYRFTTANGEPSFAAGSDDYEPGQTSLLEKIAPGAELTASMLAIKYCSGTSDEAEIRDSTVMGYAYVAEVDDTRKRVRFLTPHPQRWGDRALLLGNFPEALPDLIV